MNDSQVTGQLPQEGLGGTLANEGENNALARESTLSVRTEQEIRLFLHL